MGFQACCNNERQFLISFTLRIRISGPFRNLEGGKKSKFLVVALSPKKEKGFLKIAQTSIVFNLGAKIAHLCLGAVKKQTKK